LKLDTIIRVGGATVNQTPVDWNNNLDHITRAIRQAREEAVEILCLPEQAIPGYGCEDLFLSTWLPEKSWAILQQICQECIDITVAVGLPVVREGKLFNCACVIRNKIIIGLYAKKYLANDGIYYEHRWFTPREFDSVSTIIINGEEIPFGNFQFTHKNVKIGFEICQDAWEGLRRPACILQEQGINLILNPSASHFTLDKSKRRHDLIIDSSRDFNCTYVLSNLSGNESGKIIFDGQVVIAQEGRYLNGSRLLTFNDFNLTWSDVNFTNPGLSNTKPDPNQYNRNDEFTAAVSLGLFDYLRKSRNKGFVISLSGGADSSACAVLVSEMIRRGLNELGTGGFLEKAGREDIIKDVAGSGAENTRKTISKKMLICAYQASENSSAQTFESARLLAGELGSEFYDWKISDQVTSVVSGIENKLGRKLSWETDDITLQNIQARVRSPFIWILANIYKSILLTTSNRSEGDVGYATMDGDTSGSLAPIAGIDKYFISNWLIWDEKELNYPALRNVNRLVPTAELRPVEQSQTDESDLMPYRTMVEIERLGIRDKMKPADCYRMLIGQNLAAPADLKKYIRKFFTLWSMNQWKRERTAPSFHIDDFNIDPRTWCRFPILSGSFEDELKELDEM
jgi:NAD+ synthase (glutamine-hydrolysing)